MQDFAQRCMGDEGEEGTQPHPGRGWRALLWSIAPLSAANALRLDLARRYGNNALRAPTENAQRADGGRFDEATLTRPWMRATDRTQREDDHGAARGHRGGWGARLAGACMLVAAFGACGDGDGATDRAGSDAFVDASALGAGDTEGPDAGVDAEDREVIYPGHPCGQDEQCSTGLCYGLATPQGAFTAPSCQAVCLQLDDFQRYCDSDDDCCLGHCCLDCGARAGLCVLDTDAPASQ